MRNTVSDPNAEQAAHVEEQEVNPGGQETLIDNVPIEKLDGSRLAIAPRKGQRSLDMITDCDSEELSFPKIYAGFRELVGKATRK